MNKNETIADIAAEMRYGAIPKHRTDNELLALFADRLEAAAKRERERTGNAAKMREALVKIREIVTSDAPADEVEIANIAHLALAAPPRNCDVLTAEEQRDRFNTFCTIHNDSANCHCPCDRELGACHFIWAQLPYEEGDSK